MFFFSLIFLLFSFFLYIYVSLSLSICHSLFPSLSLSPPRFLLSSLLLPLFLPLSQFFSLFLLVTQPTERLCALEVPKIGNDNSAWVVFASTVSRPLRVMEVRAFGSWISASKFYFPCSTWRGPSFWPKTFGRISAAFPPRYPPVFRPQIRCHQLPFRVFSFWQNLKTIRSRSEAFKNDLESEGGKPTPTHDLSCVIKQLKYAEKRRMIYGLSNCNAVMQRSCCGLPVFRLFGLPFSCGGGGGGTDPLQNFYKTIKTCSNGKFRSRV